MYMNFGNETQTSIVTITVGTAITWNSTSTSSTCCQRNNRVRERVEKGRDERGKGEMEGRKGERERDRQTEKIKKQKLG